MTPILRRRDWLVNALIAAVLVPVAAGAMCGVACWCVVRAVTR
jgi:hypothetical protein